MCAIILCCVTEKSLRTVPFTSTNGDIDRLKNLVSHVAATRVREDVESIRFSREPGSSILTTRVTTEGRRKFNAILAMVEMVQSIDQEDYGFCRNSEHY